MTKLVENDFKYIDLARARSMFNNLADMSNSKIQALGNGELFANTVYANKNGNGNVNSGDGYLYRGRGLFNYTGKANYLKIGGTDFVNNPNLALIQSYDVKAAVTYWNWKNLSHKADMLGMHIIVPHHGNVADQHFKAALKPINAYYNNINNRAASYNRYIEIFQP